MTFVDERYYYVYIMASASRVLYVGMTNDLSRRVREHRAEQNEGFTKQYCVHSLVHYETFGYVLNAIAREKEIKGWRREKKLALVCEKNPEMRDLAPELGIV